MHTPGLKSCGFDSLHFGLAFLLAMMQQLRLLTTWGRYSVLGYCLLMGSLQTLKLLIYCQMWFIHSASNLDGEILSDGTKLYQYYAAYLLCFWLWYAQLAYVGLQNPLLVWFRDVLGISHLTFFLVSMPWNRLNCVASPLFRFWRFFMVTFCIF